MKGGTKGEVRKEKPVARSPVLFMHAQALFTSTTAEVGRAKRNSLI